MEEVGLVRRRFVFVLGRARGEIDVRTTTTTDPPPPAEASNERVCLPG